MQSTIDDNRKEYYEKTKNLTEDLTAIIASMMDHIKILKSSPDQKDSPKSHYSTTMVTDNRKVFPLEGGYSTKIGGMWTLKNDIISPNSINPSSIQNSKATLI